jgi:hypothetical protein
VLAKHCFYKIKLVLVTATAGVMSFVSAAHVSTFLFKTDVALVESHWREKALSTGNAFHA